jgi:hypothetical protein
MPVLDAGVAIEMNSLLTLACAKPLKSIFASPAKPTVITLNRTIWTRSLVAAAAQARPNVKYPILSKSENFTPEYNEIMITTAEVRTKPIATHFKTDLGNWKPPVGP